MGSWEKRFSKLLNLTIKIILYLYVSPWNSAHSSWLHLQWQPESASLAITCLHEPTYPILRKKRGVLRISCLSGSSKKYPSDIPLLFFFFYQIPPKFQRELIQNMLTVNKWHLAYTPKPLAVSVTDKLHTKVQSETNGELNSIIAIVFPTWISFVVYISNFHVFWLTG